MLADNHVTICKISQIPTEILKENNSSETRECKICQSSLYPLARRSRLSQSWCLVFIYKLSPQKLQSAFGYRLRKNPLWNLKNQTKLWNYDYLSTIQWRPHLIWPSSHKEIWIFVKQIIGPFLPSFVTWMYVASMHRQIVFTKHRLANIFIFHAYLSNKGCSWQPKSLSDM